MTTLKFGTRTDYCDFKREGNGVAGIDPATDFACRINNRNGLEFNGRQYGALSADGMLVSELLNCDPVVWPSVRSPAEQLRLALNAAERVYRKHLANRKDAFFSDERAHWQMCLAASRSEYQKARRERDRWSRGKTTDRDFPDPAFPKCGTDHGLAPYIAYVTGQVS